MFAAYGLDVLDARAVSPRRLWVLLNRLPPAARSGGEDWSAEANLLALLCDHVANLTWVTLRASGAKSAPRPKPLPRPRPRRERAAASRSQPHETGREPSGWERAALELAAMPGVEVTEA
jgi:hypothetical protein